MRTTATRFSSLPLRVKVLSAVALSCAVARDKTLRGAAGRAFLAAYLDKCRLVTAGLGAASVTTSP